MFGMFPDRETALRAIASLEVLGYSRLDMSVIMSGSTRERYFDGESARGTTVIGDAVATVAAEIRSAASGLPAGATVTVGPIATTFADSSKDGNVVGALIATGLPRERAVWYAHGLSKGGIIVAVDARESDEARVRGVVHDEFFAFDRSADTAVMTGRIS